MSCTDELKLYVPQISPGNPNITPPSASVPALTLVATVSFTYPYATPTLTVQLRAPELSNLESKLIVRTVNITRGVSLKFFRDPIWPKYTILKYTFIGLSSLEKTNLQALILASIGKDIGFLDHQSRQWRGVITNPNAPITQTRQGCGYEYVFEFQGNLV